MNHPETRYVRVQDDYLELHSWDGLYRGVVFRSAADAEAAMHPSRAYFDLPMVEAGLLPKGAMHVSGAASAIDETRLVGDPDNLDPALIEEQRVAVAARVAASRYVTIELDAQARLRNPDLADQYQGFIDMIERTAAERLAAMARC